MTGDVEKHGGGGLRLVDGAILVAVGVVAVVVAFWILGAIAGLIWAVVKIAVVVALVVGALYLLVGRRK